MTVFDYLIMFFWVFLFIFWIISAIGVKKNIKKDNGILYRLLFAVALFLIVSTKVFQQFITSHEIVFSSSLVKSMGVFVCAAGIAFAIWARRYLGKNWGMPMSQKENIELVITGPYTFVRHPIYTGIILAIFGSALVSNTIWWLIFFVIFSVYFIFSAKIEEKIMIQQFKEEYLVYKKKTKMLIPFLF